MTQDLRITDADFVRRIEISRPESKNGLTTDLNRRLIEGVSGAKEAGARVLIITGAGGSFSSGLDLKAAMADIGGDLRERARVYFHGLIRAIRDAPLPTIAAVDGAAAGFGCDLALACDLRIVSDRARFGEVFVRRGLVPDGGGTFLLPRLIGIGRALELMYTGAMIDAAEAHRLGIANRVVAAADLESEVWTLATRLAKGAPMALRQIKEMVYASLSGDLDAALDRELEAQLRCLASEDVREGIAAFLTKREPVFSGK
ncbi:MAG TPA: enoyl-CoA hydratase-related protein [Kofleriaceae bacterium]|nr:enoyl-CoA hydratase-related protein [Kofleriaceae bacterium]